MAGQGFSGKAVTTDVRAAIAGVALAAVRGLAVAFNFALERISINNLNQPNSLRNDWSIVYGDSVVLIGQDHSPEVIRHMPDLESGIVLQSFSTHEGLPAILVQVCAEICLSVIMCSLTPYDFQAGLSYACRGC